MGGRSHAARDRRPGATVVGHAKDQLRRWHAGHVRGHGVAQVVARAKERVDRAGRARACGPVVVTHDEDGVGGARRGQRLDRIVADPAGGVEGQLVAARVRVQLASEGPHERRELVAISRHDRLEVQVHPIRPAVVNRLSDLAGQVETGAGAGEQPRLGSRLRGRPGEDGHGEHDARAVRVGRVEDARHPRAGPATPAGGEGAIRVALQEVAAAVRTHREIGDRG